MRTNLLFVVNQCSSPHSKNWGFASSRRSFIRKKQPTITVHWNRALQRMSTDCSDTPSDMLWYPSLEELFTPSTRCFSAQCWIICHTAGTDYSSFLLCFACRVPLNLPAQWLICNVEFCRSGWTCLFQSNPCRAEKVCFLSRSNNCRVHKTCVSSSAQSLAVSIIETLGFVQSSMFFFLNEKNSSLSPK